MKKRVKKRPYPEKKTHDLTGEENRQVRTRIEQGKNTYEIADEIPCSLSQVAGIRAAMNR